MRSAETALGDAGLYLSRLLLLEYVKNTCGLKAEVEQIDLALRSARSAISRARESYEQSVRDAVEQKMEENLF